MQKGTSSWRQALNRTDGIHPFATGKFAAYFQVVGRVFGRGNKRLGSHHHMTCQRGGKGVCACSGSTASVPARAMAVDSVKKLDEDMQAFSWLLMTSLRL